MKAYGSKRARHSDWRWTGRRYGHSRITVRGRLHIKSRKNGRRWKIEE